METARGICHALAISAAFWLLVILALFCSVGPVHAATCPSYPYTLTNGQTADATQVMSNFNSILSCTNTNVARAGANSDITSLSGLLTPLSASQGGTGQSTSIFGSTNTWTGANTFSGTLTGTLVGSADKWTTARTLTLSGAVTGSASVDGSANVTLATTLGALSFATFQNLQTQNNPSNTSSAETLGNATFTTLNLNTSINNTISGASLSANQITLPAGSYQVTAFVPLNTSTATAFARCKLRNVTDSADLLVGPNAYIQPSAGNARGEVAGFFTLAGSKAVALQCAGSNANAIVGAAGTQVNITGAVEVYETLTLLKVG